MDTSKLVIKLPVDDFYNNYTQTLRELYSDSFISQNNLKPTTQNSFQRVMSKRAGISLDKREEKIYTEEDLAAIVKDTNEKYEEYTNGSYSESVKKRGQTRYVLMATVLQETFKRLGYQELAAQFKYVQKQEKTTEDNIIKAYNDAKSTVTEEDTSVKENIKLLRDSLNTIQNKIKEYEKLGVSDKDEETIHKVIETLTDTLDSAMRCPKGKEGNKELNDLIKKGELTIQKLNEILKAQKEKGVTMAESNKAVLESVKTSLQEEIAENKDASFEILIKAAGMIPGVVTELQTLKNKVSVISEEKTQLEEALAVADKKGELPTNEDELVQLAKQVIAKIEDKGKLKDIAMVIMMKAM